MEAQEIILEGSESYFEEGAGHRYFSALTKVGSGIGASYYSDDGFHNTMIHIDICPFATKLRWGLVPVSIQEELLSHANLLTRLQSLKPTIVILGVELLKVVHLLPGFAWKELKRTLKTKTVVQINYAVVKVKFVGKVLFIQTTPTPFPFLRFTDEDKQEIGVLIKRLAFQHNISTTPNNTKHDKKKKKKRQNQ